MPVSSTTTSAATRADIPENRPPGGSAMSRRQVLQLTAASVLGIALGACSRTGKQDQSTPADPNDFWMAIVEAVRAQHPDLTVIAAEAELASIGGRDQMRRPTVSLRRAIQQRIADDFASGRTLLVQGWLLARTEVVAAVVATGPPR